MERNNQGQITSWTGQEGELRDTHLNIIRTENQIKRLQQEIQQLQNRKKDLVDEGTELYLTELDIKRIEAGCP